MGSGDISEKIRTYNWPDNRITDHRIQKTYFGIEKMMNGEYLEQIINEVIIQDKLENLMKLI